MRKVQICNKTKNTLLIEEAFVAKTFITRLKGLLGKTEITYNEALVIIPCNSVHTIGMKFTIDVIFVTKYNKVCKIISNMKKMSFSPLVKEAKYVIEVKSGFAEKYNVDVNDELIVGSQKNW